MSKTIPAAMAALLIFFSYVKKNRVYILSIFQTHYRLLYERIKSNIFFNTLFFNAESVHYGKIYILCIKHSLLFTKL